MVYAHGLWGLLPQPNLTNKIMGLLGCDIMYFKSLTPKLPKTL
jgi:hypothetical protein